MPGPTGRRSRRWKTKGAEDISIRPPARGRRARTSSLRALGWFRSTPPRGGDSVGARVMADCSLFRSTPPRGGRHLRLTQRLLGHKFRSTPPRGGGGATGEPGGGHPPFRPVSIHAPAKGATPPYRRAAGSEGVSIHAPASRQCFDPRPREGATIGVIPLRPLNDVSIHAPARGRLRLPGTVNVPNAFRSTPPRGGDLM